jgi:hypothetical protein
VFRRAGSVVEYQMEFEGLGHGNFFFILAPLLVEELASGPSHGQEQELLCVTFVGSGC